MNEGVSQIDQDVVRQTKQLGAPGPIDCALLGRKVSQTECSSASLKASASDFERCLSCATGRALAATSHVHHAPWRPEPVEVRRCDPPAEHAVQESAVDAPPPAEAAGLCGWELVKAKTGIPSHIKLADTLRCTQSSVSLVFRKVAAGEVPRGSIWDSLLALSGLSAEQIMGRPVTPEELLSRGGWPKGKSKKSAAPEAPATEAPAETSTEDAADLDVAMSRRDLDAEPGGVSEADIEGAQPPADMPPPVCPSGLAEVRTEDMLHELRRRLPGMTVTIQIPA